MDETYDSFDVNQEPPPLELEESQVQFGLGSDMSRGNCDSHGKCSKLRRLSYIPIAHCRVFPVHAAQT